MNAAQNNARIGLFAGLLLAIAGIVGGFAGFVIALLLGVVGFLVGRYLDGELDVSELSERVGVSRRATDQ